MIINTASLQAIFTGFNAAFQNGFATYKPTNDKVASRITSATEVNLYAFLGQFPKMKEWLGDRVLKSLAAHSYQLTNKPYEVTVAVPRPKIEDDTYGVFNTIFQDMGYAASLHDDELLYSLLAAGASSLCYDGQYFFDTDHPVTNNGATTTQSNYDSVQGGAGNLWALMDTRRPLKPLILQMRQEARLEAITSPTDPHVFMRNEFLYGCDARKAVGFGLWQLAYGSLGDLNSTNVQAYAATMMGRMGDEGKPLGIMPNLCVVGASNWAAARALFLVPTLTGGAANPNYGMCEVLVTPYLT